MRKGVICPECGDEIEIGFIHYCEYEPDFDERIYKCCNCGCEIKRTDKFDVYFNSMVSDCSDNRLIAIQRLTSDCDISLEKASEIISNPQSVICKNVTYDKAGWIEGRLYIFCRIDIVPSGSRE